MHAVTSAQSSVQLYVVDRVQLYSVLIFDMGTNSVLACVIFFTYFSTACNMSDCSNFIHALVADLKLYTIIQPLNQQDL